MRDITKQILLLKLLKLYIDIIYYLLLLKLNAWSYYNTKEIL